MAASVGSLAELLSECNLLHLSDALADETLLSLSSLSRVDLLTQLKESGVAKLAERQSLANAFGKASRAGRLRAGGESDDPPGRAATAHEEAIVPPIDNDSKPVLVSFYSGGLTPQEGRNSLKRWLAAASAGGFTDQVVMNDAIEHRAESWDGYGSAMVATLDADPKCKGRPCVIFGHSYGGLCGLALASKLGPRCVALAVVAVRPLLDGPSALTDCVWGCSSGADLRALSNRALLRPLVEVWGNIMLKRFLDMDESTWPASVHGVLQLVRKQYSIDAMPISSSAVSKMASKPLLDAPILAVSAGRETPRGETLENMACWKAFTTSECRQEVVPETTHFSVLQPVVPLGGGTPLTPLYDIVLSFFGEQIGTREKHR